MHPALPGTRRRFLRQCATAAAAVATTQLGRAANRPRTRLTLRGVTLPDPDGHHSALKLKGDWALVGISDGKNIGVGEVSHSGDDRACLRRTTALFESHLGGRTGFEPDMAAIATLERGAWSSAEDFLTATAISGLNQALYDLVAQRAGVPVWRLFRPKGEPAQRGVPCYLQLNRTLRARATPDFLRAVEASIALSVNAVKITPFEAVPREGDSDRIALAAEGFARLEAVRRAFPDISLRVDCHERFRPADVLKLLPRFAALKLEWLEEPCPVGPGLAQIRAATSMPVATGELFYGEAKFRELIESGWADVIMPDPKHVGGFGPLVNVCRMAEKSKGQVSPHNPSGPVSTYAAVHAAAVSPAVTSTELVLTSDPKRQPARELLKAGRLLVPDAPGWGIPKEISEQIRGGEVLATAS